jgi:hypothetical protein
MPFCGAQRAQDGLLMFAVVIDPSKKVQSGPHLRCGLSPANFHNLSFMCFRKLRVDTPQEG